MLSEPVSFRYITIWTDEFHDDIILCKYAPDLRIDLAVARELIENRSGYCEGKSVYTVIDFTNVKSVTKEARDYMSHPSGGLKGILGGAFLSHNVVATLFVNLYLKVSTPIVPAKHFTNKAEALNWLIQIKNQNK